MVATFVYVFKRKLGNYGALEYCVASPVFGTGQAASELTVTRPGAFRKQAKHPDDRQKQEQA
jgi:hypothetical protein